MTYRTDHLRAEIAGLVGKIKYLKRHGKIKHLWVTDSGLREEARAHYLALAFLQGKSYAEVEPTCRYKPNLIRVRDLLLEFGPPALKYKFARSRDNSVKLAWEAWCQKARGHLEDQMGPQNHYLGMGYDPDEPEQSKSGAMRQLDRYFKMATDLDPKRK
jgi:hypothetical protein